MLRSRQNKYCLTMILGLFYFASQGISSESDLDSDKSSTSTTGPNEDLQAAIESIAHNYLIEVKSIFKQACFDCHTNLTSYPWYYTLPVIKTKIDQDIAEAREHLDFSNDYPFMSKGKLTDDLEAIAEVLLENKMPPLPYAVLHRTKSMNDEQKKKVILWVEESLKLLSNAGFVAYNE